MSLVGLINVVTTHLTIDNKEAISIKLQKTLRIGKFKLFIFSLTLNQLTSKKRAKNKLGRNIAMSHNSTLEVRKNKIIRQRLRKLLDSSYLLKTEYVCILEQNGMQDGTHDPFSSSSQKSKIYLSKQLFPVSKCPIFITHIYIIDNRVQIRIRANRIRMTMLANFKSQIMISINIEIKIKIKQF